MVENEVLQLMQHDMLIQDMCPGRDVGQVFFVKALPDLKPTGLAFEGKRLCQIEW